MMRKCLVSMDHAAWRLISIVQGINLDRGFWKPECLLDLRYAGIHAYPYGLLLRFAAPETFDREHRKRYPNGAITDELHVTEWLVIGKYAK